PMSIAEKIAARVNAGTKNEDLSSVSKTSSEIDPSLVDSKTSTKNEDLSFVTKTSSVKNPSAINSKNKKNHLNRRKLADLAKEALTNSNELDATTSVPMDIQSE
ncbi:3739_t:CDS:2, partial [Gigaspora margarita]